MSINLISEISPAYSILCFLFALLVSGVMYYKQNDNSELTRVKVWLLATMRFVSVFIISLLLLNFVLKWSQRHVSKPVIVLGVDNSASMKNSGVDNLSGLVNDITDELSNDYKILRYTFSDNAEISDNYSFTGEETNISDFLSLPHSSLMNENIQLIVMVTDGINNKGSDPAWYSEKMKFPVYSVAVGDTVLHSDIYIDKAIYNNEVYIGNSFPLFVNIKAINLAGDTAQVRIFKDDKLIKSESVNIESHNFFSKVYFDIESEGAGSSVYKISVQELRKEKNTGNNEKYISVNVRNDKKKILFLYNSPHPDAAVFKQAISNKQAYEWEYVNISDFKAKPDDYALIVLHQLPSVGSQNSVKLKSVVESKVPVLFIGGQQSDIKAMNNLMPGNIINHKKKLYDDVRASANNDFSLFEIETDVAELNKLPPLNVPFGDYSKFPVSNVLFYQKAGMVETDKPLIAFMEHGNRKYGIIAGEGLWRWKLYEYRNTGRHSFTNDVVLKTVQYLTNNDKKDRLALEYKHEYFSHEPVIINAKVYNASNELITEPELNLELKDKKGSIFKYVFNKQGSFYKLNTGNMEQGEYLFTATADLGDITVVKKGSFVVIKSNTEQLTTLANHNLLYKIADRTGGKVFSSGETGKLTEEIKQTHKAMKIVTKTTSYSDLLNNKWLFVLVFLLIATEWFLRKYWGGI